MTLLETIALRRWYFAISAVVVVLDQISKALAHRHLAGEGAIQVIPQLFSLWYSRNRGGLFGYFSDMGDPWRGLLLTVLPMVAVVFIVWMLLGNPAPDRPTRLGLALILGGAVGNQIDRIVRGEVIDFLDVYAGHPVLAEKLTGWFGTAHWPTFNVADSAIVCGACLLLLSILRPGSSQPEQPSAPAVSRADAEHPG